jgi:predicted ribosome quality control (RQC) complex YloA/Tae2 family protein
MLSSDSAGGPPFVAGEEFRAREPRPYARIKRRRPIEVDLHKVPLSCLADFPASGYFQSMLPSSATIAQLLAQEYDRLLKNAILTRVEYDRVSKRFLFSLLAERKWQLQFSFSPPDFILLEDWQETVDGFEIWLECVGGRVESVAGEADNRVIRLQLIKTDDAGGERSFAIVFELFGALCNTYLLADGDEIVHATRVIKDRRRLKPGNTYEPAAPMPDSDQTRSLRIARTSKAEWLLSRQASGYCIIEKSGESESQWPASGDCPLVELYQYLHTTQTEELRLAREKQSLSNRIGKQIAKEESLLSELHAELDKCAEASTFKEQADILMANPNAKPDGGQVTLHDFYHDQQVTIPILPGKGLIDTAATYYKTAKKLERSPEKLKPRMKQVENRINLLRNSLTEVEEAESDKQLAEISSSAELPPVSGKPSEAKKDQVSASYWLYHTTAGEKILVGKSAADNAELTFKIARSYDYWFHAQQAHGSHVILVLPDKNREPSKASIREAAELAAYFSDARSSDDVPVIYTQKRHVRKVRKGPPGKVVYEQVKSIFVTPRAPEKPSTNSS